MSTAIHPGEMVRAGLVERGWTQCDLAAILGRSESMINRLITGRVGVSIRTARELAAAFDTTPTLWLEAWNRYQLDRLPARRQVKGTKPRVKRWSAEELRLLLDPFIDEADNDVLQSAGCALAGFVIWLEEQA